MKTAANYPEDFTHKYSYDDFNYGKAELYIREPSAEELNFALEIICSYIYNNKHTVISAKFDSEDQTAKCTIEDKEKRILSERVEKNVY